MKPAVADYTTKVLCLRIVPKTGDQVLLTHHPRNLKMDSGKVYLTSSGYDFTGYTSNATFSPSVVDLEGIITMAGMTRDKLSSGFFDNARAYLFATTWVNPIEDEEPIVSSILGKTTIKDDRYTTEEMGLIDALNQSVGVSYQPQCPKVFGSQGFAGCKVDLAPLTLTGALTHVTNSSTMRDASLLEPEGYFAAGSLEITSGPNQGLRPKEIRAHDADGTLHLHEPFHYPVEVGDTYILIPGCRKRLEDCKLFLNVKNFGGFSYVPVTSSYTQVGTGS